MYKLATPVVRWSNFLSDDIIQMARDTVRTKQDKFVPTTVSSGEKDFRSSVVCWHFEYEELRQRITDRLMSVLPALQMEMQEYIPRTPISKTEVQLTNHFRVGDKFNQHVDNGSADTALRRISVVIYFSMQDDLQNRFEGGELIVHLQNGDMIVTPRHNEVVIFPSHVYHTVKPLTAATGEFLDGRLNLNCWLHG